MIMQFMFISLKELNKINFDILLKLDFINKNKLKFNVETFYSA